MRGENGQDAPDSTLARTCNFNMSRCQDKRIMRPLGSRPKHHGPADLQIVAVPIPSRHIQWCRLRISRLWKTLWMKWDICKTPGQKNLWGKKNRENINSDFPAAMKAKTWVREFIQIQGKCWLGAQNPGGFDLMEMNLELVKLNNVSHSMLMRARAQASGGSYL